MHVSCGFYYYYSNIYRDSTNNRACRKVENLTSRQNISSKTGIFGIRSFRQSFYKFSTLSTMPKTCRKLSSGFRHRMPTFQQPFSNLSTIVQGKNDHGNVDIPPSFRQSCGSLWRHCVRALMSLLYRHPMCDTTCRARELGHCDAHSNTINKYFDYCMRRAHFAKS